MPRFNTVHLAGYLTADPYFEALDGGRMPYMRFNLMVLRDDSQGAAGARQQPADDRAAKKPRCDILRVVAYGVRASVDYYYLCKGAQVSVTGWLEARRYHDKQIGRWRWTLEVNAQHIVPGRGSNFARGDAQRQRRLEDASGRLGQELLELPPAEIPVEQLDELAREGAPL
jgi:single-stranded DNA-binding protein